MPLTKGEARSDLSIRVVLVTETPFGRALDQSGSSLPPRLEKAVIFPLSYKFLLAFLVKTNIIVSSLKCKFILC